jgi:hypothetical protein
MKLLKSISMLMILAFCPFLAAGPGGSSGGQPRLIDQISVADKITQLTSAIKTDHPKLAEWLQEASAKNKIVGFAGSCKIVDFPSVQSEQPRRYWYFQMGEKTVIDPQFFQLSMERKVKILSDLAESGFAGDQAASDPISFKEIAISERVQTALELLRNRLAGSLFEKWIANSYTEEMKTAKLYGTQESCFVTRDNQVESVFQNHQIIAVRAFTQARPGAAVYFSTAIDSYENSDLAHVIASELGHHLPIGSLAKDETVVNNLAAILILGNESTESRVLMSELRSRLLVSHLLYKNGIRLPEIVEGSAAEEKIKIKGEIPKPIQRLRYFFRSEKMKIASLSVLDGFNELLGDVKLTSLRSCATSYWLYSGVEYDRTVKGGFQQREPTEMEEIKMNLYQLDNRFCSLVNNVFGKTFIEYSGYGTSWLDHAEVSCMSGTRPADIKGKHISNEKLNELRDLDRKITSFKSVLCDGFTKIYSNGIAFQGTQMDREMILAVEAGNVARVREYLKAGVSPNLKDTRVKYNQDFDRGADFSTYWTTYSTGKSLIQIADWRRLSGDTARFDEIIGVLLDAGVPSAR